MFKIKNLRTFESNFRLLEKFPICFGMLEKFIWIKFPRFWFAISYDKSRLPLEITEISRGKRDLSYEIADQKRGNFIQINFSSIPKHIENFSSSLKFDSNVLRFLVLNKTNNVKKF